MPWADYMRTSMDFGVSWTTRTNSSSQVGLESHSPSVATASLEVCTRLSMSKHLRWLSMPPGTLLPAQNWQCIACSADCQHVLAGVYGGYIFSSSDWGTHWTKQTNSTSQLWGGVAMSSSGSLAVACVFTSGYVYTSYNTGVRLSHLGMHTLGGKAQLYKATHRLLNWSF